MNGKKRFFLCILSASILAVAPTVFTLSAATAGLFDLFDFSLMYAGEGFPGMGEDFFRSRDGDDRQVMSPALVYRDSFSGDEYSEAGLSVPGDDSVMAGLPVHGDPADISDLPQLASLGSLEGLIMLAARPLPGPTVTSCSPDSGPDMGGTRVTLKGENFLYGSDVYFGGLPGTSVSVYSSTTMFVTTPAHVAGTVDVVVINPDGRKSGTLVNGFTYIGPPPAPFDVVYYYHVDHLDTPLCCSTAPAESFFYAPSEPTDNDILNPNYCYTSLPDNTCVENCLVGKCASKRGSVHNFSHIFFLAASIRYPI